MIELINMSSPNKSSDGAIGGPISLAKVRNIIRLSSDVTSIGTPQCILLAKVAELFTSDLIHAAYLRSTSKSVDYADLCEIVHEDESLDFIRPLIPKKMTYADYKAWSAKRKDDLSLQPSRDQYSIQQSKKKPNSTKPLAKKVKSAKDMKGKKKMMSPARKKTVICKPGKKQNSGIKKYFVTPNNN